MGVWCDSLRNQPHEKTGAMPICRNEGGKRCRILRLTREFGLSDVGLRKICRRLAVPTPGNGYWAKVRSGRIKLEKRARRIRDASLAARSARELFDRVFRVDKHPSSSPDGTEGLKVVGHQCAHNNTSTDQYCLPHSTGHPQTSGRKVSGPLGSGPSAARFLASCSVNRRERVIKRTLSAASIEKLSPPPVVTSIMSCELAQYPN